MRKLKTKFYNFLRWSEKYTKTDMVYLFEGSFWMGLEHFVITLLGLITVVIFANLLSPETYGSYKYILSFIGILAIPALPGMNTAITQSIAKGNEGSFIPSIKIKIKWGFLSTFFGFCFGVYYFFNQNYELAISFTLIGAFIPLMETFGLYINYLQGKKIFSQLSQYNVYSYLITSSILIITVLFTNNLFILLTVYLSSWTLVRLLFFKITLKKFPPNKNKDQNIINYSKHLSLMRLISTLSLSLDKILLWHFLGAAQVATYILASVIPTNLNGLIRILNRLAFPKLAKQNISIIKKTLLPKIFKLSLIVIIIIILYIIFAPFIFKILFPQYLNAILYSQILSLILLIQPITLITTTLTAHIKKKELYLLNIIPPIFQIILLIILIPFFGILGAIFSTLGAKITNSFLLIYFLKKS